MIKLVAILILVFTCFLTALSFWWRGFDFAVSSFIGGLVMLLNLLGLGLIWKFIFFKKSIAFATTLIIFKYLILGMILLNLNRFQWMQPLGFVFGLSSLIFGVLSAVIFKNRFRTK